MLKLEPFGFEDCIDIWNLTSLQRIDELKGLVTAQKQNSKISPWLKDDIPRSYLVGGYCGAALSSFSQFIVERKQEDSLIDIFQLHMGNGAELSTVLLAESNNIETFTQGFKKQAGEDVIRSVKVRLNQHVFRRMIMNIYDNSCCITGLNIPQVNRASHIIPWAEDESKRLDPSNGLYLSATYDSAFDNHLISLDDDYRILLSKEINDHYTHASVKEYFVKKEGQKISLPQRLLPNTKYLEYHRSKGCFN